MLARARLGGQEKPFGHAWDGTECEGCQFLKSLWREFARVDAQSDPWRLIIAGQKSREFVAE
jgi:hypothetical protein